MKKLIFILFVLIPLFGNAQFFDYSASIESGYLSGRHAIKGYTETSESYAGQNSIVNPLVTLDASYPSPSYYGNLNVGFHFFDRKINFKTSVITMFSYNKGLNFNPFLSKYVADLYYNPDIPIKIGWRHNCGHTISSKELDNTLYNSAFNNIYIKLTIKK